MKGKKHRRAMNKYRRNGLAAVGGTTENDKDIQHGIAKYCIFCETWLNGPQQWQEHIVGKKHCKAIGTEGRTDCLHARATTENMPSEIHFKITEAWQWLEDGKLAKEQESIRKQIVLPSEEIVAIRFSHKGVTHTSENRRAAGNDLVGRKGVVHDLQ